MCPSPNIKYYFTLFLFVYTRYTSFNNNNNKYETPKAEQLITPDLNMTQDDELSDRKIQIIMIIMLKALVEK